MDYSQLSDFEINKRVAEVVYKDRDGLFVARNLPGREEVIIVAEVNSEYICIAAADYCNKPADAWPIIVDNEISLNSYGSAWEASFEHDSPIGAFGTDETVTSGYEHRNPLRAAMIAFLMKQERLNANS